MIERWRERATRKRESGEEVTDKKVEDNIFKKSNKMMRSPKENRGVDSDLKDEDGE